MRRAIFSVLTLIASLVTAWAQSDFSLRQFPDDKIMVVAHRGDWRNAPENSVWSIRKAIEAGADMVEVDLKLTKDSVLILMHDRTIDRTTTGKGKVSDHTWEELSNLYLRDGAGHPTQMRIPTLEEALTETKDKIFVNLDQGFDYISIVMPMLEKYEMLDQVLFKGNSDYDTFDQKYGQIKDRILYMPIIRLEKIGKNRAQEIVEDFIKFYHPYGFEFTVGDSEDNMIDFKAIADSGCKVWVNSLWYDHNAGHNDDKALEDPSVYQWYIDNHINIIQTDRISTLVQFLRGKGLKM